MIHVEGHFLHDWCRRWCAYLDTATVAVLALAIGLILGEMWNSGWDVVVRMLSVLAASTIIMFSTLAVWGLQYERRAGYRQWATVIVGAMLGVVGLHLYPILPEPASDAVELIAMALVAVFIARHGEWRRRNHCR